MRHTKSMRIRAIVYETTARRELSREWTQLCTLNEVSASEWVSECVAGVFLVGRNSLWKLATEASIAPYNLHMKTITKLPSLINLQAALGELSVQLFFSLSPVALFSATVWCISANCKQVILNMVSCHYVCIFFILLLHFDEFFFSSLVFHAMCSPFFHVWQSILHFFSRVCVRFALACRKRRCNCRCSKCERPRA